MPHDVIAVICDCDGTLCADTSQHLVRQLGLNSESFWEDANARISEGWDAPLSYLNKLLEDTNKPESPALSKSELEKAGKSVEFYPGAMDFVQRIQQEIRREDRYREANVSIEWYIISSGIESILRATKLRDHATDIFGCAFDFDACGRTTAIKRAVTFTEKTKFIYAINKGIPGTELRSDPYRVNSSVTDEDRRIPFKNMVYIGDGPSDIPCFSLVRHFGGEAIGVIPPDDKEFRNPYWLTQGRRITAGPYTADYRENTDLYKILFRIVAGMAEGIVDDRNHRIRSAPRH